MKQSGRYLAFTAMSIPAGALADNNPVKSRIMWTDAPVIMDEHGRGSWRREKRICEVR